MKIKTLHIKGHKNLEDARLEHTGDLIAIIGNNGCGKSNLLEAISCIFKNLYKNERNIPFDFYLEYITSDNKKVEIEKEKSKLSFRVDSVTHVGISDFLPKKIVAIYSGEEDRLWKQYYRPFYLDYISNINRERHASLPQMLYLNKFYWNIALLCLSLSENNREFLEQVLGITKIEKIKFEFTKSNYDDFKNSPALHLVKTLDYQTEHTFKDLSELLELLYSVDEIFSYLYIAFTPDKKKIINDITVMFNDGLTIEDLSEGQKKLLLLKSALEFAGQEDTLYLLDEPDAHVHVNNKDKVIEALKPYIHNRQVIVTTHSPTITQCIDENDLFMMSSGCFIPKNQQEIIEEITGEFWNAHQQNNFLSSKKDVILLVEGKHDKEHILNAYSKLKDEYVGLDFDIFNMNSANNIPQMMTGLRTNEVVYNKLFIGIFDDDNVGKEELNKTNCSFDNQQNRKRHKEGFFAIKYPKHSQHKSTNFTVENFFSTELLEQCYSQALNESFGTLNGLSIDSISEKIMDKAKTKLSEASANFEKNDFNNFRLLFDLIKSIKEKYNTLNQAIVTNTISTEQETAPIKEESTQIEYFYTKGYLEDNTEIDAKGFFSKENECFTVLKDSLMKPYIAPSCPSTIQNLRKKLIEDKIVEKKDGCYIFKKDYIFTSPSSASGVVLGRASNGWKTWKNDKQEILDKVYRTKE